MLERAVSLTNNLLEEHKNKIGQISLVPSSGGVFDVFLEEEGSEPKLIFTKKQVGRKPNPGEVEDLLRDVL